MKIRQRLDELRLDTRAALRALTGSPGQSSVIVVRRHEIGVRVAVGASPARVWTLVLSDAGRLALVGLALGGSGTFFALRSISAWVHDVPTYDPLTLAAVAGLVFASVLLVSALPARRASTANLLNALRRD